MLVTLVAQGRSYGLIGREVLLIINTVNSIVKRHRGEAVDGG